MTSILGISAFYHDSAAALIKDGKIIAAAQEERFSRKKHDSSYPFRAVEYVLKDPDKKGFRVVTDPKARGLLMHGKAEPFFELT